MHDTAVLGGGGMAEQSSVVLGGGGMAEHEIAVAGGGGMAEQSIAVLGGGGIAEHDTALASNSIAPMLRRPGPGVQIRRPVAGEFRQPAVRHADKDAERVPGRVGVDPQWLLRVIRAVLEQPGAERERPLMLDIEVGHGGHRGVEVQLLRDRAVRPGRLGQLVDLLERQRWAARRAPAAPASRLPSGLAGREAGGSSPGR